MVGDAIFHCGTSRHVCQFGVSSSALYELNEQSKHQFKEQPEHEHRIRRVELRVFSDLLMKNQCKLYIPISRV